MKILYCKTDSIEDNHIQEYARLLPAFMLEEIFRYRFTKDQKYRLLSRLMLLYVLKNTGNQHLINNWERAPNNKPCIQNWFHFSISHSGEYVLFCFNQKAVGIDIEEKKQTNYEDLTTHFHPDEQKFILNADCITDSFYEIWVKKEAILKAMGTGIVNGLNEFSCTENQLKHHGSVWYFHLLELDYCYAACIVTQEKQRNFMLDLFNPTSLF